MAFQLVDFSEESPFTEATVRYVTIFIHWLDEYKNKPSLIIMLRNQAGVNAQINILSQTCVHDSK